MNSFSYIQLFSYWKRYSRLKTFKCSSCIFYANLFILVRIEIKERKLIGLKYVTVNSRPMGDIFKCLGSKPETIKEG